MSKDLIKHYFRIALGIFMFGLGIGLLIYDNGKTAADFKWYDYIIFLWNYVWITGFGLFLLDVNY